MQTHLKDKLFLHNKTFTCNNMIWMKTLNFYKFHSSSCDKKIIFTFKMEHAIQKTRFGQNFLLWIGMNIASFEKKITCACWILQMKSLLLVRLWRGWPFFLQFLNKLFFPYIFQHAYHLPMKFWMNPSSLQNTQSWHTVYL